MIYEVRTLPKKLTINEDAETNLRNGSTEQSLRLPSATLNYTAAKKGRSNNKLNKCKSQNKRLVGTTASANL
jgi:hypothetical protein